MVEKKKLDEIVAAKELSPTYYSNQTLLNMSSELHLLDASPITELDVATNENRTGTVVDASEALKVIVGDEEKDIETSVSVTVGGPAEIIVPLTVSADGDTSTKSEYVGDVEEFKPWYYMTPDWDTQRKLKDIPVVVPPEPTPVIPQPQEILKPESTPPETMEVKDIPELFDLVSEAAKGTERGVKLNKKTNVTVENEQSAEQQSLDKTKMVDEFRRRLFERFSATEKI